MNEKVHIAQPGQTSGGAAGHRTFTRVPIAALTNFLSQMNAAVEALGLRVDRGIFPFKVTVIDSCERPNANLIWMDLPTLVIAGYE